MAEGASASLVPTVRREAHPHPGKNDATPHQEGGGVPRSPPRKLLDRTSTARTAHHSPRVQMLKTLVRISKVTRGLAGRSFKKLDGESEEWSGHFCTAFFNANLCLMI